MSKCYRDGHLSVIKNQFVLAVGGFHLGSKYQIVEMLDVSSQSPCWIPMMDMLVSREDCGVGTLDNCIYAVSLAYTLHILSYNYICYNIDRLVDFMEKIV